MLFNFNVTFIITNVVILDKRVALQGRWFKNDYTSLRHSRPQYRIRTCTVPIFFAVFPVLRVLPDRWNSAASETRTSHATEGTPEVRDLGPSVYSVRPSPIRTVLRGASIRGPSRKDVWWPMSKKKKPSQTVTVRTAMML